PLPKEPETTTQAASSPATSPATSTAMTAQSPATAPATSNAVTQQSPATSPADKAAAPAPAPTNVVSTPATVLAPATVQESSVSDSMNGLNSRTWLVGGLLVAGILLLIWVVFSEFRRRVSVSVYRSPAPASGPSFDEIEPETAVEKMAAPKRLAGGPPQVSLHLKASEPSVRRGAVPLSKPSRPFGTNGGITAVGPAVENFIPRAPAPEQKAEPVEMPIVEPISETVSAPATELAEFSTVGEPEIAPQPVAEISTITEEPVAQGPPIPYQVPAFETESPMAEITKPEPEELPAHLAKGVVAGTSMAGVGALRHSVESPSFAPKVISTEPLAQQPTTPATMPQPNQPTPAPSIRPSPMTGGAPQVQAPAPSGMQTAVQLTFSFEIASLQLTPSFKMGALQLKPTSKIVT